MSAEKIQQQRYRDFSPHQREREKSPDLFWDMAQELEFILESVKSHVANSEPSFP
jgi:hypothetical protein